MWRKQGWMCVLAGVMLAVSGQAQELLWSVQGATDPHDEFLGPLVYPIDDFDQDGYSDIMLGSPSYDFNRGRVLFYSGGTGSLLRELQGTASSENWGISVALLGDRNGDGSDEIAIGATAAFAPPGFGQGGRVDIMELDTEQVSYSLFGQCSGCRLGVRSLTFPDLNGDLQDELIVVATEWSSSGSTRASGRVYVYSGTDTTPFTILQGEAADDRFGFPIKRVNDLDGDDFPDLIVSSQHNTVGLDERGRVYVYSGATMSLLYFLNGDRDFLNLGYSLAGAGDLDQDGYEDFFLGSAVGQGELGLAFLYSGQQGNLLTTFAGESIEGLFGRAVAGGEDVDGDGWPDFLIGAFHAGSQDRGMAYLYSGRTHRLLHRFEGERRNGLFGFAVTLPGDLDGDGLSEMIVSAPAREGNVFVYSGNDLFLDFSALDPAEGDTLEMAIRGGESGALAGLFLTGVNGVATFQSIVLAPLDIHGEWTASGTFPPGVAGNTLTFQALAQTSPTNRSLIDSAPASLSVQPPGT